MPERTTGPQTNGCFRDAAPPRRTETKCQARARREDAGIAYARGGLPTVACAVARSRHTVKAALQFWFELTLALRGDGKHFMPLDNCIETMRQTGEDMKTWYKEALEALLSTCRTAEPLPAAGKPRFVRGLRRKLGIVAAVTTALAGCGENLVKSA